MVPIILGALTISQKESAGWAGSRVERVSFADVRELLVIKLLPSAGSVSQK